MRLHIQHGKDIANEPLSLAAAYLCRFHEGIALSPSPLLPRLPALQDGQTYVEGWNGIIDYVKETGAAIDLGLSDMDQALLTAYTAYLDHVANDLYLATFYLDRRTFDDLTRPDLSARLPFPFNYARPLSLHTSAKSRLEKRGWLGVEGKDGLRERMQMESLADEMLETFDNMLNERKYLFGDYASSLDLLLTAFISLFLRVPGGVVEGLLQKNFPRLREWAQRNHTELTSSLRWDECESISSSIRKSLRVEKETLRQSALVVGGFTMLVIYAIASGKVRIQYV